MQLSKIVKGCSIAFIGVFATAVHAGSSDLSSLDCGFSEIKVGMTLEEIEANCDPDVRPAFISEHTRPIPPSAKTGDATHDEFQKWMYYPPNQQTTHVVIRNGTVVRIFAHNPPIKQVTPVAAQ